MDRSRIYSGLAVMAGLIVLGAMLPAAVREYRGYDRTVNVKGLCEREVKADKVIWPIAYKVMGDNLQRLYAEIDANNAIVKEFLMSGGLAESEFSFHVPSVSDKFAGEYGNNDRTYRYIVTNVINVCSTNVDAVMQLMTRQSELLRKGVVTISDSWEYKTDFRFEGLNGIKPEMIEEATRNARAVAGKFAKDSGSRLGKIKTADQGTFVIENRDGNTPEIKKVRVVTYVTYYLKN